MAPNAQVPKIPEVGNKVGMAEAPDQREQAPDTAQLPPALPRRHQGCDLVGTVDSPQKAEQLAFQIGR